MLCFVPVLCVCLVCLLLCKEEGSSLVSLQLLRGEIWACMRGLVNVLWGFGMGTMLANLYICGIVLNMSTSHFRCLMFSLS